MQCWEVAPHSLDIDRAQRRSSRWILETRAPETRHEVKVRISRGLREDRQRRLAAKRRQGRIDRMVRAGRWRTEEPHPFEQNLGSPNS